MNLLGLAGFICLNCESVPDTNAFPYCTRCLIGLTECPDLCARCFSIHTEKTEDCAFLTIEGDHGEKKIDSLTAAYQLTGPGYRLLRQWKKHPSPLAERRFTHAWSHLPQARIDAVVPVPQTLKRQRALRGGSSVRLANRLSWILNRPMLRALTKIGDVHQASSANSGLRLERDLGIRADFRELWPYQRILLVDDFLTTGETLRQSTRALKLAGVQEVHAWVLGFRPRMAHENSALESFSGLISHHKNGFLE